MTVLTISTACSSGSDRSARTPSPSADAQTQRVFTLGGEAMRPCSNGFSKTVCGTLEVPENRDDPSGRRIGLSVVVVPAVDAHPAPDPVFFLAGGPGGAATESWLNASALFHEVHAHRDIVLVDQRGTGDSNLLLWPEPPDVGGLSDGRMRSVYREWVREALADLDADPRFYTSAQAADDLDDVRAALGYDQIDLYGGSYGATLAQYYLRQHGDHARAVVLDGGTLLDVPVFEVMAPNSQEALDSVIERCAAEQACHSAFPDPAGDLAVAVEQLSAHPVKTGLRDPWTDEPIVVDGAALATAIHGLLVTSASEQIPRILHLAAAGVVEPVAELIRDTSEDPATVSDRMVMSWSVVCLEGWARFGPARTADLGSGSYFVGPMVDQAEETMLGCSLLPYASPAPGDGAVPHSAVPVLLLNGTEDPQDPPSNVAEAPQQLPNSLTIPIPGLGHTVGHFGCLPDVVAAFFAAGSVEGLDTSCVDGMVPAPFVTP